MNLLIMELMPLPREAPLILLAPDSDGSTTFFSFSSEKALLASKIAAFYFYLSAEVLMMAPNLPKTSPIKSAAPSGGFSFSSFFFLFLSSFPPFFAFSSSFTSDF